MTGRPDDTLFHDWLDDSIGHDPDPVEGTRQVMSQVEETSQVGRWLPFGVLHRRIRTRTAATDDTTEYRAGPISPTNGHTHTLIGRTHTMLSPVKAISVGAIAATVIAFALGGVLFIAGPLGPQGDSVPGAATEAAAAEPVPFTLRFTWLNRQLREAEDLTEGGVTTSIGSCNAMRVDAATDPRIGGELTFCSDEHVYGEVRDESTLVWTDTYRIVNEEGAWQGSHGGVVWDDPGSEERWEAGGGLLIFSGVGAYDGLYAAVYFPGLWSEGGRGFIFEGPPPPAPAPPAAE